MEWDDVRRLDIGLDEPHFAIFEVFEQRVNIDSGNFTRPDNLRVIYVSVVVNPLDE
jgi:hypothetical protein